MIPHLFLMGRNGSRGPAGFISLLGSGLCGETRVLKYRVVLKVLILLQTRLHPVASSGLTHEGEDFRMDWNAFMLGGRGGTEGGWTVQPSVSTWWVICIPDGQGTTTWQRLFTISTPQEVGMGPHTETKEAGNTKKKNLVLKKLMQWQTLLQGKEMQIGIVKARSEGSIISPLPGPVSPLHLTKLDKTASLYQCNMKIYFSLTYGMLYESEGKVRWMMKCSWIHEIELIYKIFVLS